VVDVCVCFIVQCLFLYFVFGIVSHLRMLFCCCVCVVFSCFCSFMVLFVLCVSFMLYVYVVYCV